MLSFEKYDASGNDFILFDLRSKGMSPVMERSAVTALCDRRKGVGADGCVFLLATESDSLHFAYYNADGSKAKMCGNAARATAHYLKRMEKRNSSYLESEGVRAFIGAQEEWYYVILPSPKMVQETIGIDLQSKRIEGVLIDAAVPHFVSFYESSLDELDLQSLGPLLVHHERFQPHGANINFVERAATSSRRYRTYERGVNGETLSCATAACAIGWYLNEWCGQPSPISLRTQGGHELVVEKVIADSSPLFCPSIKVGGEVRLLYTGRWQVDLQRECKERKE